MTDKSNLISQILASKPEHAVAFCVVLGLIAVLVCVLLVLVLLKRRPKKQREPREEKAPQPPATQEIAAAEEPEETPLNEDGTILRVEHLKKYFPIKKNFFGKALAFLHAVDDVSFGVLPGTAIGVVGESGCGKTTLGRTVLRLYDVDGGDVYFEGAELSKLKKSGLRKYRTDIQLIFQDPYSSLPPRMTVGAIIAEAVKVHHIVPKGEVHDYVLDVMKKCGLQPQYYDRYPHEFSGGQRQRICIARALAVKPKLVICDEPVSALDVSIQAQIINLLKELQETMGLTYVFISHDLSVVKYITDQIMVMYLGNVMELGMTEDIFKNPLHPYTQALFSAVPVPDPDAKMNRIILEGDIPSPANPPRGCKFHTRCAKCMNACRFKAPKYLEEESGHFVACHLYDEEIMNDLEKVDREYAAWLLVELADEKKWEKNMPELERVSPETYLNWVKGELPKTSKYKYQDLLLDALAKHDKETYFKALSERITDGSAKGKRKAALIARLKDAEPEKHTEWLQAQLASADEKEKELYQSVLAPSPAPAAEAPEPETDENGTQG